MLSHGEAQALVSARLDGPLDPIAARELEAHLATCPSCRAFNASSTQLMRGLREMPYLPASPAVKRAVIDHISTPRTPWNVISGPWLAKAVPVATAVAAALVLTVLGAFAYQRLNDTQSPLDAVTSFLSQPAAETEPPDDSVTLRPTDQATESQPASDVQPTDVPQTAEATDSDVGAAPPPTQSPVSPTPPSAGQGRTALEPDASPPPEPTATAIPTEMPTATVPPTEQPTSTPAPTAEPTATAAPSPTATATPDPTAEPTPTAVPTEEPTATVPPTEEPSATAVPTEVPTATVPPTEEPTATAVPTEVPTSTTEATTAPSGQIILPVDGTVVDAGEGEATQEDQAAGVDPTPVPSAEDDITPTAEGQGDEAGVIAPIEGQTPVDNADEPTPVDDDNGDEVPPGDADPAGNNDPATEEATDEASGEEDGVIEPIGPVQGTADATESSSDEDTNTDQATETADDNGADATAAGEASGEGVIEPRSGTQGTSEGADGTSREDTAQGQPTETPDGSSDGRSSEDNGTVETGDQGGDASSSGGSGNADDTSGGPSLGSAREVATTAEVPGDPGARLGVNDNNGLEFSVNPGRVSLSSNGVTLEPGEGESGQAVLACDESGSCADISTASAEGSHSDYPLGWIGSDIIYERIDDDGVSFRAVRIDSGSLEIVDDRELGGGGFGLETLIRPYPVNGGLLVPSPDAWLFITTDSVSQVDSNPFGADLSLIRIAPASGSIAYVAGGDIIIASLQAPGTPQATVPFTGSDFDVSPDGSEIVVTDGAEIRILGLDGTVVRTFANDEGVTIGGIIWTQGRGIVYADLTNGVLRSIEP